MATLADVEQRVLLGFRRIATISSVKILLPLDQVQVTVRRGIKGAGINGDGFVQRSSRKAGANWRTLILVGRE
jgi:hypothetical protein